MTQQKLFPDDTRFQQYHAENPHICSVSDCSGEIDARGYCNKHYLRFKKYGDPSITIRARPQDWLLDAMRSNVEGVCLIWPFSISASGYGNATLNGKYITAHRLALILATGQNPSDQYALHRPIICHNRACVNWLHLYWGTPTDNVRDMLADGTMPIGERCYSAKLTADNVRTIRIRLAAGEAPKDIGTDFGISRNYVSSIRGGFKWRHVT